MKVKQLNLIVEKYKIELISDKLRDKINNSIEELIMYIEKNKNTLIKINPKIIKMIIKKIDNTLSMLNKHSVELEQMVNDEKNILDYPQLKDSVEKGIIRLLKLRKQLKKQLNEFEKLEINEFVIDDIKKYLNDYLKYIVDEVKHYASFFGDSVDELNRKLKKETGVVLTKIKVDNIDEEN